MKQQNKKQKNYITYSIYLGIILNIQQILCDLPVHCSKEQISGRWRILKTEQIEQGVFTDQIYQQAQQQSRDSKLYKERYYQEQKKIVLEKEKFYPHFPVTCGHQIPDVAQYSYQANPELPYVIEKELILERNDQVYDIDNQLVGNWTMVYDEGFEVLLEDEKFFWFSKYYPEEIKPDMNIFPENPKIMNDDGEYENQYKPLDYPKPLQQFVSNCSETLVGWYFDKETKNSGCSIAFKSENKQDSELEQKTNIKNNNSTVWTENGAKIIDNEFKIIYLNDTVQIVDSLEKNQNKENKQKDKIKINALLNYDESEIQKTKQILQSDINFKDGEYIDQLLRIQKAIIYSKESEDDERQEELDLATDQNIHSNFIDNINKNIKEISWQAGISEGFKELNIQELNNRAGRKKFQKKLDFNWEKYKSYQSYSREDVSDLPSSFSWEQYLNIPIEQGDCGSCYVITTLNMISMRLKIMYGENIQLSIQHVLDCNFYNQGCDGGYSYLVSKFANEYELYPEYCSTYQGIFAYELLQEDICNLNCNIEHISKTYSVSEYGYIGGAYGKTTERKIMEEILNNGPVVLNIEPNQDLMYYQSGIYHSVSASDWIIDGESPPEWEQVDHSVLCYGWGESQNGEKYWLLQNSWGLQWGENGNFRMRRGTDESGIESMGEYAIPIILSRLPEKKKKEDIQQQQQKNVEDIKIEQQGQHIIEDQDQVLNKLEQHQLQDIEQIDLDQNNDDGDDNKMQNQWENVIDSQQQEWENIKDEQQEQWENIREDLKQNNKNIRNTKQKKESELIIQQSNKSFKKQIDEKQNLSIQKKNLKKTMKY